MTETIRNNPTADLRIFQHVAHDTKDRMIFVDTRNDRELAYFKNTRLNRAAVWLRARSPTRSAAQRQKRDIGQAYERFTAAIRASQPRRDDAELRRVESHLREDMRLGQPLTSRKVRHVLAQIAPGNPDFALANRHVATRFASASHVADQIRSARGNSRALAVDARHQMVSRADRAAVSERVAESLSRLAESGGALITAAQAEAVVRREVEAEVGRCEARLSGLASSDLAAVKGLATEMEDVSADLGRAARGLGAEVDPADAPAQRRLMESKVATARRSLTLGHRNLDDLAARLGTAGKLDDQRRKLLDDLRENLVDLQIEVADLITDFGLDEVETDPTSPARLGAPQAVATRGPDWFAPVAPPSDWQLADLTGITSDGPGVDAQAAFESYLDAALHGTELHTVESQVSAPAAKLAMRRMLSPATPMPEIVPDPASYGRFNKPSLFPSAQRVVGDPGDLPPRELRDRLNVLQAKRRSLQEVRELADRQTPLTAEELQAVEDYITTSSDVNGVLCGGKPSDALIDRKIAGLTAVLDKLPDNRVTTYRALRADSGLVEQLLASVDGGGTVLTSKGFISTSVAPEVSKGYLKAGLHKGGSEVVYEVRGLRGKNIAALPDQTEREMVAGRRQYMSEQERLEEPLPNIDTSGSPSGEILFRPGTRFLLAAGAKHHETNRYAFILKELSDDAQVPQNATVVDLNRLM